MTSSSIFLIPVASPLHVERVMNRVVRARELLEAEGFKVFGPTKPICFPKDIPDFKVEDYDLVVVFVASGGTSSLVAEIASDRKLFLWAYHENNSLPSALAAREKLEARDAWKSTIAYSKLTEVPKEILAEASSTLALKALREIRLAALVDEENEEKMEKFRSEAKELLKTFGLQTVFVSFQRLDDTLERVQPGEAEKILNEKVVSFELLDVSQDELFNPIRLYVALRRILLEVECKALTIDCFDFIVKKGFTPCLAISLLNDEGFPVVCEADLSTAPLLIALTEVSKKPVWMANLARIDEGRNRVTLAHCTAPTSLMDPLGVVRARSHFESDSAVSLDVPLSKGEVTLAHLKLKPPRLTIALGEIVNSQMGYWKLCRSQAEVKLKGSVRSLFNLSGNHQIVCYGDYSEMLLRLGEKLGVETVCVGLEAR